MSAEWLSRLKRRAVESLSWGTSTLSGPLIRCRDGQGPGVTQVGIVQTAGETVYRRELQAFFPPAPLTFPGRWPTAQLYRITDARVSGLCGSIFLPNGELLSVCSWVDMLADKRVRRPSRVFEQQLSGPVLHLLGRNHENHGHFLFEYLPRVVAAERWLAGRSELRIGIAGQFAKWQRRYLGLLGYSDAQVVELWPGSTQVKELFFVPRLSGLSSLPDPALLRTTVQRLQAGAHRLIPSLAAPSEPGRVAFISRDDAPNKRLLNEAKLVACLRTVFPVVETVLLSKLTFAQQLEVMSRASVVVGPQGMGLSNMAFLSGRLLVCLEAGSPPPEMAWEAAYCINAELGGNRSITLYGLEERQPPHRNFSYPVNKFEAEIRELAHQLAQTTVGQ